MTRPLGLALARQGDVNAVQLQAQLPLIRLDGRKHRLQTGFHMLTDLVGQLADRRPLIRRQGTHAAQNRGQLALFAEELDPQLLDRLAGMALDHLDRFVKGLAQAS